MGNTANRSWPYPESSDFVADGATAIENLADAIDGSIGTGYSYVQTLYFTSSGTFTKASYSWLRAVRVRMVGGGGGSSGSGANIMVPPGAGGGGGYSEAFIVVGSLAASETVTVGSAGAGGAADTSGAPGGTSSFGSHCSATGGNGGVNSPNGADGGVGGVGVGGDLNLWGSAGGNGHRFTQGAAPNGGSSQFAGGAAGGDQLANGALGATGLNYGGGAGAPFPRGTGLNQSGSAGGIGIVMVELYA